MTKPQKDLEPAARTAPATAQNSKLPVVGRFAYILTPSDAFEVRQIKELLEPHFAQIEKSEDIPHVVSALPIGLMNDLHAVYVAYISKERGRTSPNTFGLVSALRLVGPVTTKESATVDQFGIGGVDVGGFQDRLQAAVKNPNILVKRSAEKDRTVKLFLSRA